MRLKYSKPEPWPVWLTRDLKHPLTYYRATLPARMTGGTVKLVSDQTASIPLGTPTIISAVEFEGSELLDTLIRDVPGMVLDCDDNLMEASTGDVSTHREIMVQAIIAAVVTGDSSAVVKLRGRSAAGMVRDYRRVYLGRPAGISESEALALIRDSIRAVWNEPLSDNVRETERARTERNANLLRLTPRLIASTEPLAAAMAHVVPDADIRIAPYVIDPADFPRNPRPNDGIVRIGHASGPLHRPDAQLAMDALKRCATLPNTEVWFFGWHPHWGNDLIPATPKVMQFEGMTYHHGGWTRQTRDFQQAIGKLDIALAPLQDTAFTRCKSPQKWFEFASNATPVVVSDCPVFSCVDHGVTGFKAQTPEEFTEYALMLCNDAALRKRIGQAAHDDVMARHTVSAKAETWRRAVGAGGGHRNP